MIEATFNPTLWWFFSAGSLVAVIAVVDGRAMPVVCSPFLLVQLELYKGQTNVVGNTS